MALKREFLLGSISNSVFIQFLIHFPFFSDEVTTWISLSFLSPETNYLFCYLNFVTVSFRRDAVSSALAIKDSEERADSPRSTFILEKNTFK